MRREKGTRVQIQLNRKEPGAMGLEEPRRISNETDCDLSQDLLPYGLSHNSKIPNLKGEILCNFHDYKLTFGWYFLF